MRETTHRYSSEPLSYFEVACEPERRTSQGGWTNGDDGRAGGDDQGPCDAEGLVDLSRVVSVDVHVDRARRKPRRWPSWPDEGDELEPARERDG